MTASENEILPRDNLPSRIARSQSGFTLIEMIVAAGLCTIAVCLFSTGFLSVINSAFFAQETLTRNDLSRTFKNAVLDRRAFQVTANASDNPIIKAVITNDFSATGSIYTNQFYDMSIYDSSGLKLTGPPGSPVYYMVDGSICPPAVPYGAGSCIISATSTFMVQGLPDYDSFDRMSSVATLPITGFVSVNYPSGIPSLRADFILVGFQIEFHPKPGILDRKPAKVSIFVNVDDLGF